MAMHSHFVKVKFQIKPTELTDKQVQQFMLVGLDLIPGNDGRYTWFARCDASSVISALIQIEGCIQRVIGYNTLLTVFEVEAFQDWELATP